MRYPNLEYDLDENGDNLSVTMCKKDLDMLIEAYHKQKRQSEQIVILHDSDETTIKSSEIIKISKSGVAGSGMYIDFRPSIYISLKNESSDLIVAYGLSTKPKDESKEDKIKRREADIKVREADYILLQNAMKRY